MSACLTAHAEFFWSKKSSHHLQLAALMPRNVSLVITLENMTVSCHLTVPWSVHLHGRVYAFGKLVDVHGEKAEVSNSGGLKAGWPDGMDHRCKLACALGVLPRTLSD